MSDAGFKRAFEEALPRFLADPRSVELLATVPASAWHRGGSMAFASALADCLGGTLMSLGWYAQLADHVVVALDGMLLDAQGVYSEAELLAKHSLLARAPLGIWLLTPATVTQTRGSDGLRRELGALLASYLPAVAARPTNEPATVAGVERRRRLPKDATAANSKTARV